MSHLPERNEKNCLNCEALVHGRYCHVCGQENVVTKESFWSLARHFIYDILHFDGNFFFTLMYIFTRPGYVARQYAEGRRVRYLHPIRMYLFTSAIFFLIFFSIEAIKIGGDDNIKGRLTNEDRIELSKDLQKLLQQNPYDTALRNKIALLQDTAREVNYDSLHLQSSGQIFKFGDNNYSSLQAYDSIQQNLVVKDRDGWFEQKLIHKTIQLNEKYKNDSEGVRPFLEVFLHKLPYMLFLSLPFFALILKLLYVRRKNFYYSDHSVFTLYHYIFSFILMLLIFGISSLQAWLGWRILTFLILGLMLVWPVYLLLELKIFYRQGWVKTLSKFLLLNFLGITVLILLFIVFLFFSIFQM